MRERDGRKEKNPWAYLSVGLQFAAAAGAGAALGWWLDARYGWEPWATVLGTVSGVAVGTYQLLRETL